MVLDGKSQWMFSLWFYDTPKCTWQTHQATKETAAYFWDPVSSKLSKTRPETDLRTGLKGKGRGKGE